MQFTDFPFPNSEPESYVGCQEMEDYLLAYTEKHQLKKYVCFNTKVNSIDETFTVIYTTRLDGETEAPERPPRVLVSRTNDEVVYSEKFDAVCVANGHYSEVYIPNEIPGLHQQTFPIQHSRTYRDPEPYRGKCVIVVGASHSGIDICGELAPVARKVILSMKEENINNFQLVLNMLRQSGKRLCTDYLSSTFSFAPPIERLEKDTVHFPNQTSVQPDLIIFATGYQHQMPFLQGRLQVDQGRLSKYRYVYPLYKQLFHADFPRGELSFLTIPYRIIPFPLAELQSHIIARVLCGQVQLPSREQMICEIDSLRLPQNRAYHCVNMIEYTEDLLELISESDRYFNYKFTIDSQRRVRKILQWFDHVVLLHFVLDATV